MITYQKCGTQIKAGLTPAPLIQKSTGLVICQQSAQDKHMTQNIWICADCQKEHEL